MNSGRKGKALQPQGLILLFAIVAMLGVIYFQKMDSGVKYRLEIVHVATGTVIIDFPVLESEKFQIHYTHSVDCLPVRETFRAEKGQLVLDEVHWMSFGAGLGYMDQGKIRVENEWIIIEQMNRRVGQLLLRVGTIADHRLVYRGEEYPLKNYVEGRELVQLSVARQSR
ncbi:MAG: DUF1850 domain-containing protein [Clostridia bacterium]|nr:DUF1850 domain-containing protein [Clostridia bacterium]